jgi:hypothetical protein
LGQIGAPLSHCTPRFSRTDELAPRLPYPLSEFFLEIFMNCTRSILFSSMWFLALAVIAGCEQDRVNNIPPGANLTASGSAMVTYTAQQDGTVWVYDVNNDRIDYSGPLTANQSLVVNSDTRQITVDARVVSDKALNSGAQHRIYFLATTH